MSPFELLLLAGAGAVAGWMNVMAGGGSLLTIPVMLFLGLPGPVANGTNRIAILGAERRGRNDISAPPTAANSGSA